MAFKCKVQRRARIGDEDSAMLMLPNDLRDQIRRMREYRATMSGQSRLVVVVQGRLAKTLEDVHIVLAQVVACYPSVTVYANGNWTSLPEGP